jgi:hypothetical protein
VTAAARKPVERPALRIVNPPAPSLGLTLSAMWEPELERNALGAAMLGEPMPPWLESRHFFPSQHQAIYEAVKSVGGHVARVNTWLRESAPAYGPIAAGPVELAAMCEEYACARSLGWAFEWAEIRELWRRRALVEACTRVVLKLRDGRLDHGQARGELAEHFKAVR